MKKLLSLWLLAVAFSIAFPPDTKPQMVSPAISEAEARTASGKAIQQIQHAQTVWYKRQVCTSCHHQLLPEVTLKLARERDVSLNEALAKEMTGAAFASFNDLDGVVQGYDYIDVFFDSWRLASASRAGIKPSLATAAYAQFIASRQQPDGSWPTIDCRPPQAYSPFAATAIAAEAIRQYLPPQFKGEQETRLQKARAWLLKAQPRTLEDQTFQLFGLLWTGAAADARQTIAQRLLSEQRADGGWGQLPTLASDAYSTGEVLVVLREGAGVEVSDPAYQRGLRFLLNSQQPDGSWRVTSRLHPPAPVSPPYVDTEFPEGHDQFISIMGTSWAVNALLRTLPVQAKPAEPIDLATAAQPDWVGVALNGSAAELKTLLDNKLSPNVKTAAGTSLLMFAARDAAKVKLLLARGADVNARATTGITPLMVAARYKGNAEVVRLLLEKGAKAEVKQEVRNDASALFYAVMAGDAQMVGALIAAGAKLNRPMNVLGTIPTSPLAFAVQGDEARLVDFLISKGVAADEVDGAGLSGLAWSVITNHIDTLQVLLARGARVNRPDNFGMTPLLYAASIDFGDTTVLEKLIAAGADLQAKNKQGQTALDLAKRYHHANAVSLLSER